MEETPSDMSTTHSTSAEESSSTEFRDVTAELANPPTPSPARKTKIIEALCPKCKETHYKERAVSHSFHRCSETKAFVLRYESTRKLFDEICGKQTLGIASVEDEKNKSLCEEYLKKPEVMQRYQDILDQRAASSKPSKKRTRSLLERAQLGAEIVVPLPKKKKVAEDTPAAPTGLPEPAK